VVHRFVCIRQRNGDSFVYFAPFVVPNARATKKMSWSSKHSSFEDDLCHLNSSAFSFVLRLGLTTKVTKYTKGIAEDTSPGVTAPQWFIVSFASVSATVLLSYISSLSWFQSLRSEKGKVCTLPFPDSRSTPSAVGSATQKPAVPRHHLPELPA